MKVDGFLRIMLIKLIKKYSSSSMPIKPTYVVPEVPTLSGITVPEFGGIQDIDTTVPLPDTTFPDLDTGLEYTNALWTSANLDDMASHMSRVRAGDFAINATIWGQVFDRAMSQIRREARTREREGRRAWSRLGWMMPGGVALAQQELAAHDINESATAKALEVAVQETVQKNEDFWKAITQGAQLEGLYREAWDQYHERGLRFAIAVQNAGVAVYNALVAKYQVQVAAAQVTIESKRLMLENERLKLEQFKAEIEAEIAKGEIDKLRMQLYIAQWDGVKAAIEVYATEV